MTSHAAQLLTAGDAAYLPAIHVALDTVPPKDRSTPAPQVAQILKPETHDGARVELVTAFFNGTEPVAAAVALVSPGRAGLVLVGSSGRPDWITAVLRTQAEAAWARGLRLLEILVVPGASDRTAALEAAGYRRLTTLIYLRGRVDKTPQQAVNTDLTWRHYEALTAPLFAQAVERSYEQSLDCPELSNLRTVQDALAGHRAAGIFDPTFWWVALLDGEPVGVILLSRLASKTGLELVYMGTAAAARGRGVGDALIKRAFHCASRDGVTSVALAVDARNVPARGLYKRWGFSEVGVRDAWIASPPDCKR